VAPPIEAAAAFGILYRPMTDEDLPFAAALYASVRAEEVAMTGWPPQMQAAFLEQQHQAQHRHYRGFYPDGEWLIVERDGEAIGRLYLADEAGSQLLMDISLLPQERGAGLGTAILTDLVAAARNEGRAMTLHVEAHNPARRLYERFGFATVEEGPVYLRMVRPADA